MDYATEVVTEDLQKERDRYQSLVFSIIDYIKKDVDYEGTGLTYTPTAILDKIYGMAHDLPEIKGRIYG